MNLGWLYRRFDIDNALYCNVVYICFAYQWLDLRILKFTYLFCFVCFYSVKIPVRQPTNCEPLKKKVPPPVAAKPAKVNPASNTEQTEDFPPPPPSLQNDNSTGSAIDDELDALTDMLALGLQNTHHPDFFGKSYYG